HVKKQERRRSSGQQKLDDHPVVSEQAPFGADRLHDACQERRDATRDDDKPGDHLGSEIRGARRIAVPTPEADDGKGEKGGDGAQPADRHHDVRGERELSDAWFHGVTSINIVRPPPPCTSTLLLSVWCGIWQ